MKKLYFLYAALLFTSAGFSQASSTNYSTTSSIRLSDFNASPRGGGVELSWNALNEDDMLRHEIEKSTNGSAFTTIGSVTAQNNSSEFKYSYLDGTPVQGNNYYRLRSINRNGTVTYSTILQVNLGVGRTDMRIISNPAIGHVINLQLTNLANGKYAINVYNTLGQKFYSQSMDLAGGSSTQMVNLPSNVSRGMYLVQLTDGSTLMLTKQVVVQ